MNLDTILQAVMRGQNPVKDKSAKRLGFQAILRGISVELVKGSEKTHAENNKTIQPSPSPHLQKVLSDICKQQTETELTPNQKPPYQRRKD